MFYFVHKERYCQICICPFDFISLYLLVFTIEKFQSLKHFSTLCPMKNDVRFKYVPWKEVWFFFIFIVWVHFSHKTEKFLLSKSLKYLINIFWSKNMMEIWITPVKQCLIWFKLRCLSKVLAKSWKIRVLNFIFLN